MDQGVVKGGGARSQMEGAMLLVVLACGKVVCTDDFTALVVKYGGKGRKVEAGRKDRGVEGPMCRRRRRVATAVYAGGDDDEAKMIDNELG